MYRLLSLHLRIILPLLINVADTGRNYWAIQGEDDKTTHDNSPAPACNRGHHHG